MIQLLQGDALSVLATLAPGSIQTVITSPPYYGLRKYSDDPREIGQEAAPDCLAWARREPPCGACYVCALRAVFAAVWRVLRDDGTCWINLGDSMSQDSTYQAQRSMHTDADWKQPAENRAFLLNEKSTRIPSKNLLMIPARVALALQSDGWIVRSDVIEEVELYCPCGCGHVLEERIWRYGQDREIIWEKPNAMPESVRDRPTRAHEYVFLLSKQARYYYDQEAIAESAAESTQDRRHINGAPSPKHAPRYSDKSGLARYDRPTRNKRSVWTIATRPYAGAHFATMPEALIEPCLLASSSAQACETCGAAWGRVVERETTGVYEARPDRGLPAGMMPQKSRAGDSTSTTLGFAPRCACPANTGAAFSTVLDCFAGTFTVGRVAERFGRNAIGIELNPDYSELSDARTNGVQKELFV